MLSDILDIVNEEDSVIGSETRLVCHEKGILHRGANVLTFRDNSYRDILIQKRSKKKEPSPGKLCTPGGHLDRGETYLDGAKREFFEEMHVDVNDYDNLVFEELFKMKKKTHNNYEFITTFRTVSAGPFSSDPNEVESYYFESIDKILDQMKSSPEKFTQTSVILLEEYARRYF